jgi:hypothetical protein
MLKSHLPKLFIVIVVLFLFSCQKNQSITQNGNTSIPLSANLKEGKKIGRFTQTNLVSDIPGMANRTDPSLMNAWGLTWHHLVLRG